MSQTLINLAQPITTTLEGLVKGSVRNDCPIQPTDLNIQVKPRDGKVVITRAASAVDANSTFFGHCILPYKKAHLSHLMKGHEIRLAVDAATTSGLIAQQLAKIFQIHLTPSDVIVQKIAVTPGMKYTLMASPASPMWQGSRVVRLFTSRSSAA